MAKARGRSRWDVDEDGRKLEDFNPLFAGSIVDGVKSAISPDTPFFADSVAVELGVGERCHVDDDYSDHGCTRAENYA